MNISDSSCRLAGRDNLLWVEVADLVAASISGGAIVGVVAEAVAFGNLTWAVTTTLTSAKSMPSGGSIAKGMGLAIAIGDNPLATVDVFGSGDKTIEHIHSHYFANKNMTVTKGFVIAIDHP